MKCYTYGVFDLLHIGHLKALQEAANYGNKLIVGVFTDKVAKSFKRQPVIPQEQRFQLIKALKIVDNVVYQDELSPLKNIKKLHVDMVVKGPGAGFEDLELPVKKVLLPYHPITSTTKIIEKIRCS